MTDFSQLTEKQKQIYECIREKIESRGYGPTVREIGDVFGIVLIGSLVLTGGEALTYDDIAAAFAAELGHDVQYHDVPPEVSRDTLRGYGMPAEQVEDIVALFAIFRAGYASTVSPAVADVLGRSPRSLKSFIHDHRSLFTTSA